jgi:hypothetical protein
VCADGQALIVAEGSLLTPAQWLIALRLLPFGSYCSMHNQNQSTAGLGDVTFLLHAAQ